MHGQTFKTILSEGGGEGKHFCDYDCVSIPGKEGNKHVFLVSQPVLSGVVGYELITCLH